MLLNDAQIQIATAFPPVKPLDTRKGRTFSADIWTDRGRTPAYLKLLRIEDVAREALCATLAQELRLPIFQAYYVYVDPSYVDSRVIGNDQNTAFGLRKDPYCPMFAIRNANLESLLQQWPDAMNCAVFDEWIFNSDRLPNNLIFDSTRVYWLIDHDEALPNHASPTAPANSSLLRVLSGPKSEHERWRMRNQAMQRVHQFEQIEWDRVLDLLRPNDLPGSESHYVRYINFLRDRIPAMHDIITASIGIRQTQLDLGSHPVPNDKSEEKT